MTDHTKSISENRSELDTVNFRTRYLARMDTASKLADRAKSASKWYRSFEPIDGFEGDDINFLLEAAQIMEEYAEDPSIKDTEAQFRYLLYTAECWMESSQCGGQELQAYALSKATLLLQRVNDHPVMNSHPITLEKNVIAFRRKGYIQSMSALADYQTAYLNYQLTEDEEKFVTTLLDISERSDGQYKELFEKAAAHLARVKAHQHSDYSQQEQNQHYITAEEVKGFLWEYTYIYTLRKILIADGRFSEAAHAQSALSRQDEGSAGKDSRLKGQNHDIIYKADDSGLVRIQLKISPSLRDTRYREMGVRVIYAPKIADEQRSNEGFMKMCAMCTQKPAPSDSQNGRALRSLFLPELAIPRSVKMYEDYVARVGGQASRSQVIDTDVQGAVI